ncbi:MAG: FAD-dependent oxidoreductase, partial [Myxococcota bacterium]
MTDLCIVGAGVCGVAAAYEACRRGLDVVLVDRGDVGGGASSNSMHVAHGGLRYLQSLDLARSFESIRERRRLLRLAPHCVRPFPFRLDRSGHGAAYRGLVRVGLLANDVLSLHRNRGVRADRRLPRARGGVWYDALIEDTERLMVDALHGADAAPGTLSVRTYADAPPPPAACTLRCTGAHRASAPGAAAVLSMNLVLPRLPGFDGDMGVALRHPDDGRNVFVTSVGDRSVVGTHDRAYAGDPSRPLVLESGWIDDVIAWLRPVHPALSRLARRDLRRVHAGLLPGEGAKPGERAVVESDAGGVVHAQPVKWTTAWGVALRAVDRVCARLGRPAADLPDRPLPDGRQLQAGSGIDPVRFAVEREWARRLDDVLLRR